MTPPPTGTSAAATSPSHGGGRRLGGGRRVGPGRGGRRARLGGIGGGRVTAGVTAVADRRRAPAARPRSGRRRPGSDDARWVPRWAPRGLDRLSVPTLVRPPGSHHCPVVLVPRDVTSSGQPSCAGASWRRASSRPAWAPASCGSAAWPPCPRAAARGTGRCSCPGWRPRPRGCPRRPPCRRASRPRDPCRPSSRRS